MKEGWEYKKLGEVASYINGYPFKPSDWKECGKPIIRIQNLTGTQSNFNRCPRTDIPEKYFIKKGDILISWSATLGVFEWKSEDALLNQHIFKVVFDKAEINKQYFQYAIIMSISEMSRHTNGATMKHIRKGDFDNIKIPLPPLSEQQSIVEYLDSAFAKIDTMKANAEKALNEAKALFQASLKEMLEPKEGWEEKYLKDIAEYSIGLTYKPTNVCNDGTIVLRSSNIQEGKLDLNDIVRVNASIKENLYVRSGDILMCSRNGSARLVGKVCIIPDLEERMTYGTFMMVIRSAYNPLLYHYFDTELFRSQIKHGEANMINQITRYMLDEVKLYLPPIKDQQSIVETLDSLKSKVDRLQANYDKISQECDALKQSILRQVFE